MPQDKDKDKEEELLQEKLIKAYGSHSNIGMTRYHIMETAKAVLPSKQYSALDAYLNSYKKSTAKISEKLHISVGSLKRLYRSAVETLVNYQEQRKRQEEEEFYSVRRRFKPEYSF